MRTHLASSLSWPARRLSRAASLFGLLVLLTLVLSVAPVARAQGEAPAMSEDEVAIRDQYKAFDALLVARDLDGVAALMLANVKFESGGKKVNLTMWRRTFDVQVKSLVSCKTRVEAVQVTGKSANVKTWCEQRYKGLHVDGSDSTRFIIRSGAVDVWAKTPEGWRLKSSTQQESDIQPLE